jgi:hypothetical protein
MISWRSSAPNCEALRPRASAAAWRWVRAAVGSATASDRVFATSDLTAGGRSHVARNIALNMPIPRLCTLPSLWTLLTDWGRSWRIAVASSSSVVSPSIWRQLTRV